MSRVYLAALAATLALAATAPGAAQTAPKPKPTGSAAPAHRIDILRWPVYQGATLLQQSSMSAKEIEALASQVDAKARAYLRGLKQVAVAEYQLAAGTDLRPIIAFYEPRVLAAGYKVLHKDFSEADEVVAVYTGSGEHCLVISAEREGEGGGTLEIVAVEGPLSSLAGVADAMIKVGQGAAKPGAKAPPGR